MRPKNDQVFQLSLTEMFIIVCFILLLLMGYQIFKITHKNQELASKISLSVDLSEREKAISLAANELKLSLAALDAKDPDDIINRLIDASKAKDESDRLKILIKDKDSQITALTAIEKSLQQVKLENKGEQAPKIILQTLMFYEELKKLIVDKADEKDLTPDEMLKRVAMLKATETLIKGAISDGNTEPSQELVQQFIENAKVFNITSRDDVSPVVLQKANKDLRGQVQYLTNRLNLGRGVDLPPCWVNEKTGKIEMFLTLELREDSVTLEPAWPTARQEDAMALPGIANLLGSRTRSYNNFMQSVKQINDFSKQKECRFYVRLASLIPDAVTSDRRRLTIETVFYKTEVRR